MKNENKIKPEELRLGNWLHDMDHFKGYFQVLAVEANGVLSSEWFLDYDKVCGIPLSSEWLERFGFTHEGGSGYKAPHNTEHWYFTLNNWFMPNAIARGSIKTDNYIGCKYVHQLQNLYYCLTGKELDFKP